MPPTAPAPTLPADAPVSLCQAYCGQVLRVVRLPSEEGHALRLRELGFCERSEVRKVRDGGALVCVVCGVRMAIGRELAESIWVAPVHA